MPSPQPFPTGEGVGCGGFKCCRPSEKECPKHQQQEFFRQPLSQGRWNKRRERFFRRPLNPSVGCVPQGTHAGGWGYRENGERVRAYRTHSTFGLQLAVFLAEPLIPTAAHPLSPWERVRERATSRKACILSGWGIGEGCRNLENALSPTLPHGGGSRLQRIQALQVV